MKIFGKRKDNRKKSEIDSIEEVLPQLNANVSKLDYYEAAIKSLLQLHPEAYEQEPLVNYYKKLREFAVSQKLLKEMQ